jgi:outer membrane protein assembly factor BamB
MERLMANPPGRDDAPLDIKLNSTTDKPLVVRVVGEKRGLPEWLIVGGIPGVLVIIGVVVLMLWMNGARQTRVAPRLPAPERQVAAATPGAMPAGTAAATGTTTVASETPAATAASTGGTGGGNSTAAAGGAVDAVPSSGADWPGFRGPNRNGISGETGLLRSWGASGPQRLWSLNLGEGHAGAAVYGDRVYILDYDQGARQDRLICVSLSNGKQLWSQSYPCNIKNNHGLSRTVPAVDGKYVVTLGPLGMVMCCRASDGKVVWKHDLVKEYGTVIPEWYAGQCPLIESNNAIIAPGGKSMMVAFHLPTGKATWTAPNPRGWKMTHSSITPINYGGKRVYVYPASGGVVGVNAANGKILWDTPDWTVNTSNIPAPINIGDGRIYLCGGYNSGAMMIRMNASATGVSQVFRTPFSTFQSHQQTPILYKGYLYGVKAPNGELVCMDLNGKIVWTSGVTRFGLGPYTLADGMLYVLSAMGQLSLVQASPSGFKQLASAKVLSGHDAWAPMALVGGRLLARDATTMVCLKVK